jgi:hypothetical protein
LLIWVGEMNFGGWEARSGGFPMPPSS